MKKVLIAAVIAAVALASVACGGKKGEWEPKGKRFSNSADSVSYALGLYIGQNIAQSKDYYDNSMAGEFKESLFLKGLRAAMKGKPGWSQEQTMEYLQYYFQNILPEKQEAAAEKKKADGVKFLEKIEKESGVQKTESGLLYRIDVAGNDVKPTMADQVEVKYKGTKTNGEVFDSTPHGDQETATFPLGGVVRGFSEGLQLIGEGGKITIWLPESLGYGSGGPDPNMPLIFEVELVKVIPAVVEENDIIIE